MKKNYTKPQMEVIEMTATLLVPASKATSIDGNSDLGLGGGSSSGGRGRESDDWDDEW